MRGGLSKTSLALTAAYEHQPSGNEPPLLTCRGGFYEIMRDLLNRLAERSVLMAKETRTREFSFTNFACFDAGVRKPRRLGVHHGR